MHAGEVDIDQELVRRLVATQFPQLADLAVREVVSAGTVNAIYRLGDHLCVRLPRVAGWAEDLDRERRWLPRLAAHLSMRIPAPVAQGSPSAIYPWAWAIYAWIEGQPYADALVDQRQAANDLAQFVLELRDLDLAGGPSAGRRPLPDLDLDTRAAIEAAGEVIDRKAATAAWEGALQAPRWDGRPRWIHADLLRPNLLVHGGRICAVLDFGGAGVGDPAADLIAAWSVFDQPGREVFRRRLDSDDASGVDAVRRGSWDRARGLALHQAAMIIPYYRHTNPAFVALARRTVEQVLADLAR